MPRGKATNRPSVVTRRVEFAIQLALVGAAAVLYFGVRLLTEGSHSHAVANGLDLLLFERGIGLAVEAELQALVLGHRWAVAAANWIYIWAHWPAIVGTLVWLHRTRHVDYMLLRNALFVSGAIGLVIFVAHPVAPPRLLPSGFTDTIAELSSSYRVLQPPSLVNKYAAMPSLHVGWNLLVGLSLYRARIHWIVSAMGLLSPLAMSAAVVMTGNHYVIDVVVGAAVALAGLAVSHRLTPILALMPFDRRRTAAAEPVSHLTPVRAELGPDRTYQPRSTHSWR